MFETGVGRAHNIALTSLPNFTLPGDTSASSRYWVQDIVEPGVEFIRPGTLAVPAGAGIGYEVSERTLTGIRCVRRYFKGPPKVTLRSGAALVRVGDGRCFPPAAPANACGTAAAFA